MIETERLRLRQPSESDRALLRAVWTDPLVMADVMTPLTPPQADAAADAVVAGGMELAPAEGTGFWMICDRVSGTALGFCAIRPGEPGTPAEGELEIGWVLDRPWWGKGLAGEAAVAVLDWCWAVSQAARIVAIVPACNHRSRRLLARIGMRAAADFDHPRCSDDDRLRACVMYRIERPQ